MNRPKTFSGRRASQMTFEIDSLVSLFKNKGVTRYLEIGARDGDTFHYIMSSLPVGSVGVAVDLPAGLWGKNGTQDNLKKACEDLSKKGYDVRFVLGDSTSREIIENVYGDYDAILIDGDHTLEGVSMDYENYGWMSDIVAFHDIVGFNEKEKAHNNPVEVPLFWSRIKKGKDYREFVDEGSTMGIGVLCK